MAAAVASSSAAAATSSAAVATSSAAAAAAVATAASSSAAMDWYLDAVRGVATTEKALGFFKEKASTTHAKSFWFYKHIPLVYHTIFTMILLPTRRSKGMERARAYVYMRYSAASVKYSLCFITQVVVRCTDAVARWPGVKVQRYEYDRTVDEPDAAFSLDRPHRASHSINGPGVCKAEMPHMATGLSSLFRWASTTVHQYIKAPKTCRPD
uniref:Uncharacterized protein n=1 Tax=Oryza rufipogon TaxID=4529 RepID=A0A0E0PA46_ORYRU